MRKLSQQWRLLTLKHNTVLIMLFGLSVGPLHSDLWDLCCMLRANAAAAFQAPLFYFEAGVLKPCPRKSHLRVEVFIYTSCPPCDLGWWHHAVCVFLGVVVDILVACGDCCQCCVAGWLRSRSKAWSTPARDYKELPTCTHTALHAACSLVRRKPGSNFLNNYHWC